MKLPRLVLEVRPRLQSCQLYYLPECSSFRSTDFSLNIQPSIITVKSDSVEDVFEFDFLELKPLFLHEIKPEEGNVITYRLESVVSVDDTDLPVPPKFIPSVQKEQPIQLTCRTCYSSLLQSECSFRRILPLPSDDFNSGDLFCHECSNSNFETNHNLAPKFNDLFYGNYFFKINSFLLDGSKTSYNSSAVHCNKCNTCLGSKGDDAIKLWNCTVAFTSDKSSHATPQGDFVLAVKNVVYDSLGTMCKIVIKQKTVSSTLSNYLLVWVMEKYLPILVNVPDSNKLIKKNVMKVLYLHEKSYSPIVSEWEKDINTHSLDVADIMFLEGVEHLKQSSLLFPTMFRRANNMNVGYLGF